MRKKSKEYLILILFIILDIIFLFLILSFTTSCRTIEYINPKLPKYELEEIERPSINEKSDDVIKLMRYAEKREIQLTNFYNFYESLRELQK